LPKKAASVPTRSCFSRQAWLKNVSFRYDVPSKISASTIGRRWRVYRPDTFFTTP
jgi:hypothetical protein